MDPLKKNQKKTPSSSSSGAQAPLEEIPFLAPYDMLLLLPVNAQRHIYRQIMKKLTAQGYSENDIDVLEYTNYGNIIKPYRKLNSFLRDIDDKTTAWSLIQNMFAAPFTARTLVYEFPNSNKRTDQILKYRVYRLAEVFEKIGALVCDVIQPGKNKIPYNRKLRLTRFWYIPGYHNDEDKEIHVYRPYRLFAKCLGRLEDQTPPKSTDSIESKAIKQLELKAVKQRVLRKEPEGVRVLTPAERTNSKIDILKEYLTNPNISRSRKTEIKSKIVRLEEKISRL